VTDLKIIWEDDALKLLMDRDRYTRNAIQEDFRADPQRNAVLVDAATREFVTRVSDERFAVVWRLDSTGSLAIVRALFPVASFDPAAPGLKEFIDRAVAQETKQ